MNFESLIMDYGYLAILIGTFIEGETILVVGGFAAYEGYLDLCLVILSAFIGSLFGDQLYFFIGRYKGRSLLKRYPRWLPRVNRFRKLMDRHNTWFILVFRFLYGLRTVAPFAIGLSNVSTRKFMVLNVVSAAVWAMTLGVLGFFFGEVMEAVLDDIKKYELVIMAGLLLAGGAVVLIRRAMQRRKVRRAGLSGDLRAQASIGKCPSCGASYPVSNDVPRCPVCGGDLKEDRTEIAGSGKNVIDNGGKGTRIG